MPNYSFTIQNNKIINWIRFSKKEHLSGYNLLQKHNSWIDFDSDTQKIIGLLIKANSLLEAKIIAMDLIKVN